MMSCTTSAAWSHHVLSLCYTEHGMYRGAVLSGRITSVVMFGAEGHVAALELTSVRRRGSGPQDTWWRWSPPLQGGVVRSYSLRDSVWMHVLLLVLT
jgi:hypothetical protein